MAPKFGTSGLRGLVTDLTPDLVQAHVAAFLQACPVGTGLFVGRDLRDSSPRIAADVVAAARAAGVDVTDCGAVPTPALALAAMGAGAAAVMVTGSHIPADRNGLKFYTPEGEITKAHEVAILAALGQKPTGPAAALRHHDAATPFARRYLQAFGPDALAGRKIGLWSQSAVSRDVLAQILRDLGAQIVEIGRSDSFIPIDTEAVSPEHRAYLAREVAAGALDAIVSTDGDGDRPLVVDERGQIVPGDVLGQITALAMRAEIVVTPVSSNTGVEQLGLRVLRTRIGSPYVIAGIAQAGGRVVGYEANGGFLLGHDATGPAGVLPRLMTRDSLLPMLAPLATARAAGQSLSALVRAQPARFTAADRIENVASDASGALIAGLRADAGARAAFFERRDEAAIDDTDGLRVTFATGEIVHLRPSGNAPECRCYAEASQSERAQALVQACLARLRRALGSA